MTIAHIQISISGGEMVDGSMRFDPGSELKAEVQFNAADTIRYRALRVGIEWHTEGYGERDGAKPVERKLAEEGVLKPDTPVCRQLRFALPTAPWSYAGEWINILWEVKATIDLPLKKDITASQRFILAPGALRRPHEPGQL